MLKLIGWVLTTVGSENSRETVNAFDYVLTGSYPNDDAPFNDVPDYRLRGYRPQNNEPVPALSTVVPLIILNDLVHEEDKNLLPRLLEYANESLGKQMLDDWIERRRIQGDTELVVRIDPIKSFGKQDRVIWFTPRSCLESKLTEQSSERAQQARDLLGLVHHGVGTPLAALHFEPTIFGSIPSARPTFIDAAGHTRFKAWPDEGHAQENKRWGVTVDLSKLMNDLPSLDGCFECVACSIHRSAGDIFPIECEFEFLGVVQEENGTGGAADNAFAARLAGNMQPEELERTLTQLLN